MSRAKELLDRGRRLSTEGKYSAASSVLKEAIEEAEWLPHNDLLRGEISHALGFALWKLGENLEAERHFRIAVEVKQVALQPNDNDTAISLNMLGVTLQLQGKLEEAETIGHRSVDILRISPSKDDKHFAYALGNLGGTLADMKKYQPAEAAYRECLEIEERLYGHNHQETALTLNNLGACLIDEERFGEATEILREAVTIKTSLSVSPESIEHTLRWLLKSLNDDEKFHEAEEECLKWLRWNDLPPDNPKRRGVTEQLEISLQQQGKVNELEKLKRTGRYTVQSAAAPLQNVPGHSPQARAVFHGTPSVTTAPREHAHATATAPAVSQLLQSPMQVEAVSGIAAEAERKLTADQEVEVAERIAGEWEKLVIYLEPDFFRTIKISEIKKSYGSPFLQARAALAMWSDHFHGKATQYKVIKALCRVGCRAQAVEVFKDALVDFVVPM